MAKLIKIEKLKSTDSIHYYRISTSDFKSNAFFMGIDSKKKYINFFLNQDFSNSIGFVDLNKPNEPIHIIQIDPRMMWPAIAKADKAIKENRFPENLDFAA